MVQCYRGSSWCLTSCSSASACEVANSVLLESALPLVIFESQHFPPSTASARGVVLCPHDHFLYLWSHWYLAAASVAITASWGTRRAGSSILPGIPWAAGSATAGGGFGWGEPMLHRYPCHVHCKVHRLSHCRVGGVMGPSVAEGMGSQASWPTLPDAYGCHGGWGDGVTCVTSPATAKFSGAAGSAAAGGNPGLQAPPHCSPSSTPSMGSSPPTFRCTEVWNSPAP